MELSSVWSDIQDRELFREFYFLSIALILAFGTLQTAGTVLDTDRPVVSVVSCSMYPGPGEEGLYKGDILVVKGTPFEQIREGDTIVYNVPDRVEFSVSGEDYVIEKSRSERRPSVDTSAGRIALVRAGKVSGGADKAILSVDGEREVVSEGESLVLNGQDIIVDSIDTMPIPVVHRVVEKRKDSLETKGINNPGQLEFEKNVRPEQVHGMVAAVIPRVGLIKIVAMDLVGFQGDRPLVLDRYRPCEVQA
jgi:signal peptidase I